MKTKCAFVFQRGKAWYVGWREPSGKQCRQSFGSEVGAKTKATHNARFIAILEKHYPTCRAALNELPLAAEVWGERAVNVQSSI